MFDSTPPLPGMDLSDEQPFVPEPLPDGRLADHYLLFFALLPPPPIALQASALAEELRRLHRLPQRAMASERMHITLQLVAAFKQAMPHVIVRAAIDAAAGLAPALRPTSITFDRALSMGIAPPSALALRCSAASRRAIAALRGPLTQALRENGLGIRQGHEPHMTLVYETDLVSEHRIEPISWVAERLSLVLSHHGRGHHEPVNSWPLLGR